MRLSLSSAVFVGIFLAGVFGCIRYAANGHWFNAVMTFAAATCIACLVYCRMEGIETDIPQIILALLGGVGAFSILWLHPGFQAKDTEKHERLFEVFSKMEEFCPQIANKNSSEFSKAEKNCFTKNLSELQNGTHELAKAIYLPPSAGLVDSISSSGDTTPTDECIQAIKPYYSKCPFAFSNVDEETKKELQSQPQ